MARMSRREILDAIRESIQSADDFLESEYRTGWRNQWKFYNGKVDFSSQRGRSSVVMSTVRDSVNNAVPQLMRVFVATQPAEFVAKGPQSTERVKIASEWANYNFMERNRGYNILQTALYDGLVSDISVAKVHVDDTEKTEPQEWLGMNAEQVQLLAAQDPKQLRIEEGDVEIDPNTGLANVRGKWITQEKTIKVENVAPDYFLIDRDATCPEDATLVGHKADMLPGEIIELGIPRKVVKRFYAASLDSNRDDVDRERRQYNKHENDDRHPSIQPIQTTLGFARVDADDDGEAELYSFVALGPDFDVVKYDLAARQQYYMTSPFKIPHTAIGYGFARVLLDMQRTETQTVRQMLDNLVLSNTPRMGAVMPGVDAKDLSDHRFGGIVRMRAPNQLQPIIVPFTAGHSVPVLEMLEARREERTGISKEAMGLNPDALASVSIVAANATITASQGKVEAIARTYAEWIGDIYEAMHRLAQEADIEMVSFQSGQEWHQFDPAQTDDNFRVQVRVGLGSGSQDEQMQALAMIAQKQEQLLMMRAQDPTAGLIVSPQQYAHTLAEMVERSGFQDTSAFITSGPALDQRMQQMQQQQSQQPEQPDPEMVKAQQEMQLEQQKAQHDAQLDQQKAIQEADLKRKEAAADIQLEREKSAMAMENARLKAKLELELKQLESEQQLELQEREQQAKRELREQELIMEYELKKRAQEQGLDTSINVARPN